jgi:hypothetical protein
MPNQKISELTAIVTVDNSVDVLPIVDISANTTKKVTPNALKTALALDNVNNTSDANKPVSIAQQDALNAKVDENAAITPSTKTKITYDAKGLVTAGNSLDEIDLPTGINANKIGTGAVSSTEFGYLDGVTSAIQTQIDGKASNASVTEKTSKLITTNRQTASYTLVLSDADKLVEMNVGSANNLTVPLNSSVAFSTGTQILLAQYGAGQTTIVATSGVTIRSNGAKLKLNAQYSGATLVKIAENEWYLFGDIVL